MGGIPANPTYTDLEDKRPFKSLPEREGPSSKPLLVNENKHSRKVQDGPSFTVFINLFRAEKREEEWALREEK